MKISFCSDLHIEHRGFDISKVENKDNADVLVLAGDIIVAKYLSDIFDDSILNQSFHKFFEYCSQQYKDVIYVCGNHEHYRFTIEDTHKHIKKHLSYLSNLHILENQSIKIDDITFIGSTLWTDMNKKDPTSMWHIGRSMNDFHLIKTNKRIVNGYEATFTPEDAYELHNESLAYFQNELNKEENDKVVIVAHHNPSYACVPKKYAGDVLMNPGYVSDLSDFILDNPKIKVFISGHNHYRNDFMIGSTRIVVNCCGYPSESISQSFELKTIEL